MTIIKTPKRRLPRFGPAAKSWRVIAPGDYVRTTFVRSVPGEVTGFLHSSTGDVLALIDWSDGWSSSYRLAELVSVPAGEARRLRRAKKKAAKS